MNGRDDDDALWSAYLDGTLDAEARARAEARLRNSAADRESLEALRAADAQMRATAVPDPGAAYWRDFGARVESRLQPAAESRPDPARIYEKLVDWLMNGGRVRWMRAAGALAGLTLVTYIGMRGFRPSDVGMRSAPSTEINLPPQGEAVRKAPEETHELRSIEPKTTVVPPPPESKHRTERDDAWSKTEVEATQPPAPPSAGAVIPHELRSIGRTQETREEFAKPPGTLAIEPQPQAVAERVDTQAEKPRLGSDRARVQIEPKRDDAGSLDEYVRGGRANDLRLPVPPSTIDKEMLVLRDRAAYLVKRSVADSLASFLALALRDDATRAREVAMGGRMSQRANELKDSASGAARSVVPAPAPAPMPPALATTAEVDRLLQLANLAQRYEADATFRPHLETIAIRLAQYASQDPRAASRARALMRTLAASSATASERATWEERLRQLPP